MNSDNLPLKSMMDATFESLKDKAQQALPRYRKPLHGRFAARLTQALKTTKPPTHAH